MVPVLFPKRDDLAMMLRLLYLSVANILVMLPETPPSVPNKAAIERLLYLEGTPNMSELFTLAIGKTVKEQFQNDLALEVQAVPRLNKAIACATTAHDNGSRDLFEKILVDEEHHVDWLEAQLHMMSEVGEGNYLAQQIHKED